MTRALALIASLLVLLTLAAAPGAAAQSGDRTHTPTELWQEFPLRSGQQAPAGEAGRLSQRRSSSTDARTSTNGPSPLIWIAGGLLCLGVLGLVVRGVARRGDRRRIDRRAEPAAGLPASAIASGSTAGRDPTPPPRLPAPPPAPPAPAAPPARGWEPPPAAPPLAAPAEPAPAGLQPGLGARRGPRFVRSGDAAPAPPRPPIRHERTFGYVTAPDAGEHRRELREQATQIHRACRELDLSLVRIVSDIEPAGRAPSTRPGLAQALKQLAGGDATCLVVTELRRLAPTAEDWQRLAELVDHTAVRVIVLDVQLDTSAEAGAWELAGHGAGPPLR